MHRSAVPDIWNTDFDGLVLKWLLKNCEFILKSLLLVSSLFANILLVYTLLMF